VCIPSYDTSICEIQQIIWNKYHPLTRCLESSSSSLKHMTNPRNFPSWLNFLHHYIITMKHVVLNSYVSLSLSSLLLGYNPCKSLLQQEMILSYNGKIMRRECNLMDYIPYTTPSMKTTTTTDDANHPSPNVLLLLHLSFPLQGGCFLISFSILLMICGAVLMSCCTCGASLIFIPLLVPFLFILPFFCL